jgi:cation:H+ antiporter
VPLIGGLEDLPLPQLVAIFVVSAAVLVAAGTALARSGDEIATRTGMGGLLVGVLLASVATSLPEIVAASSAAAADAPDLAVADLFGAGMSNMAVLAIIDLITRRRLWPAVELGHARVASMAMALTALAVLAIATPGTGRIGWVGTDSLAIAGLYAASVAWIRRSRTGEEVGAAEAGGPVPLGLAAEAAARDAAELAGPVLRFALATTFIFLSAPTAAVSAKGIAATTGLGEGFVGVALLAIATTLPELITALAAVRIGAYDLAVGNLFGSCAFNMSVLLFTDLAYSRGPVLAATNAEV